MHKDMPNLPGAIDAIYRAALEPVHWSAAMEAVMDVCGMEQPSGGVLYRQDIIHGDIEFLGAGHVAPEVAEAYLTQFHAINPWAERALALRPGECVGGEALIPPSQLRETTFYAGFLEPFGLDATTGAVLNVANGLVDVVTVLHRSSRGDGHGKSVDVLQALVPHLRRALQITHRIELIDRSAAAFAQALDQTDRPTFIVGNDARLLRTSAAAECLLDEGIWLRRTTEGELRLMSASGNDRLQEAIRQATLGDANGLRSASELAVSNQESEPVALLVSPASQSSIGSGALAIVVVAEMVTGTTPTPELLQALFDFTPAEARLAARLASGIALNHAAVDLGWTTETARWRLKQLHDKTGTRRLPELVQRLARVPALRSRTRMT